MNSPKLQDYQIQNFKNIRMLRCLYIECLRSTCGMNAKA